MKSAVKNQHSKGAARASGESISPENDLNISQFGKIVHFLAFIKFTV